MKKNENLSKVSKVKHYLYGCIKRADRMNDLLPGESELCRKFGFARGTVQRAVNELMQSNFVIKKSGRHGLYINPEMIDLVPVSIGIVMNKGISEIVSSAAANAFAGFIKAITADTDTEYIFHDLLETDFNSIYDSARENGVQGLLWIISNCDDPESSVVFNAFAERNFPAVAVGYSFDSSIPAPRCNTVMRDYAELGERMADFIRSKGYSNPLFIGEDRCIMKNFTARFGGEVTCFTEDSDPDGVLDSILARQEYDCVISGGGPRRYGMVADVMNKNDYTRSLPLILRNYFLTKRFAAENPALKIQVMDELSAPAFMFKSGEAAGRMFLKLLKNPSLKNNNLLLKS